MSPGKLNEPGAKRQKTREAEKSAPPQEPLSSEEASTAAGLSTPFSTVPTGWRIEADATNGRLYYLELETGQRSWIHPHAAKELKLAAAEEEPPVMNILVFGPGLRRVNAFLDVTSLFQWGRVVVGVEEKKNTQTVTMMAAASTSAADQIGKAIFQLSRSTSTSPLLWKKRNKIKLLH